MRCIAVVLVALACYCEARPSLDRAAKVAFVESYILAGVPADITEFPWQLSQQRLGSTWSHSCGASLLGATKVLSAAHCVDGASVTVLRIIAGVTDRTSAAGIISNVASYKMHESYGVAPGTYPNDISIITLQTAIAETGTNIRYATLPSNNNDQFVGRTCIISGWGRNTASNVLPTNLLKADIGIISTADCNQRMAPVSGASVTDNMVCLFDTATTVGSCNGDSGGPLNCQYPNAGDALVVVAGVTSWGIQSGGACAPSYPSVYTRTSAYLAWIASNL